MSGHPGTGLLDAHIYDTTKIADFRSDNVSLE
jgi:hypothetical protein